MTAREILANGGNTTCYIDLPAGSLEVDNAFKEAGDSAAQMFTKTGPGSLILGGDLVDNGGLTLAINQGEVIITKASASTAHGLGGGASIVGTGAPGNSAGLQLVGAGGYDLYHTCALTVTNDGYFDMNGQSLAPLGMGALTLSGAGPTGAGALLNSASGTTSLLYCTGSGLVLAGNATIGGPGSITISNSVISDGGHGYAITYAGGSGATLTLSNANTFSGGLTINSGGTVLLNNNTAQGTGPITINGTGVLTFNATTTAGGNSNSITGGSASVINVGYPSGNTYLSGPLNNFTGTINVGPTPGSAGQVVINQTNNVAYPISASATWNIANGATLDLATPYVTDAASVILNGPATGSGAAFGALRLDACNQTGNVTLNANSTIGNGNASASTISGAIGDNSSGYGFTHIGTAGNTIILTGANTFSGPVTNLIGTLSVNSIADTAPSALGTGTSLVLSNSTLQYTGSATATTTRTIYSPASTTNILQLTAGSLNVSTIARMSGSGGYLFIVTNGVAGNNTLTLNGTVDNNCSRVDDRSRHHGGLQQNERRRPRHRPKQLRERRHAPIKRRRLRLRAFQPDQRLCQQRRV